MSAIPPVGPLLEYSGPRKEEPEDHFVVSCPAHQRVSGAVLHFVGAPFAFLLAGAIFGGLLGALLTQLAKVSEKTATIAAVSFAALFFLGSTAWSVIAYIRRGLFRLVIYPDRMESTGPLTRWRVAYEEVADIHLAPQGIAVSCALELRSGEIIRLPVKVAHLGVLRRPFDRWLMRVLSSDLRRRLEQGESVEVMEQVSWLERLAHGSSSRGFTMDQRGITAMLNGVETHVPWQDLREVTLDPDGGLTLRTFAGDEVWVSRYATHCWVASTFLAGHWRALRSTRPNLS